MTFLPLLQFSLWGDVRRTEGCSSVFQLLSSNFLTAKNVENTQRTAESFFLVTSLCLLPQRHQQSAGNKCQYPPNIGESRVEMYLFRNRRVYSGFLFLPPQQNGINKHTE